MMISHKADKDTKKTAVLILLALTATGCFTLVDEAACSAGNWSELPEYICGRHTWTFTDEYFSGMNVVFYSSARYINQTLEKAKEISIMAEEKGLAFAAGLYYNLPNAILPEGFNYSRMVQFGKQEPDVPSPSDDRYWEEVVTKPALALANLSLYYPIYAIFWDIEIYGRKFVPRPGYSWDQYSLERFGDEKGIDIPKLNDSERYSWIFNQGLHGEFCRWQEEQVFLFANETERLVHEINPDLALGTLCLYDDWFDWAIRTGFDNERVPTLLWDEDTYDDYKASHVKDIMNKIDSLGLNCMYTPGFWVWEVTPEDLVQVMRKALTNCKSFWIFPPYGAVPGRDPAEYNFVFDFFADHFFDSNGELVLENGPTVYPGVASQVYPNKVYQTQNSFELLLFSSTLPRRARVSPITIHVDPSRDMVYWKNFSLAEGYASVTNGSFQIEVESLPLILYGVNRSELELLEEGARVEEILLLWNLSSCVGLEIDPAVFSTAIEGLDALREGNATLCNSVLGMVDNVFAADLIAVTSEYVKQAPPAQATYEIRHGLETAADYWGRGSKSSAKRFLMDALARMCTASVPEIRVPAVFGLLAWVLFVRGRTSPSCLSLGRSPRD